MLSALQDANLPTECSTSHPPHEHQHTTARGESSNGNGEPLGWGQRRNGGTVAADARDKSLQDAATANGAGNNDRCVLEDYMQCSKSHLWRLMMSFYDRKGVESWSQVGRLLVNSCLLVAAAHETSMCSDGLSLCCSQLRQCSLRILSTSLPHVLYLWSV